MYVADCYPEGWPKKYSLSRWPYPVLLLCPLLVVTMWYNPHFTLYSRTNYTRTYIHARCTRKHDIVDVTSQYLDNFPCHILPMILTYCQLRSNTRNLAYLRSAAQSLVTPLSQMIATRAMARDASHVSPRTSTSPRWQTEMPSKRTRGPTPRVGVT